MLLFPPLANADHFGLQLVFTTSHHKRFKKSSTRRDRAAELLDSVDWDSILPHDVDAYWSAWKNYFLQIMDICIPHSVVKIKRNLPRINKSIVNAIRKRSTLFHIVKQSGKSTDHAKYRAKRNQVVKMLRESKQTFFNQHLNNADTKTFWKTVRFLKRDYSSIPTLLDGNGTTTVESCSAKAACLNVIKTRADYVYLQEDVNSISTCIEQKYLQFNTTKCKLMFITRKRANSLPPPPLTNGVVLNRVFCYKYLGVTFSSDLSWSPHITNCCNKTRRLIGLLYRRFYRCTNSPSLLRLYKSFVRPHLEYATIAWNPHLKGEIEAIENVQKFSLRVCLKSWDSDYNELLRVSTPAQETSPIKPLLFIQDHS